MSNNIELNMTGPNVASKFSTDYSWHLLALMRGRFTTDSNDQALSTGPYATRPPGSRLWSRMRRTMAILSPTYQLSSSSGDCPITAGGSSLLCFTPAYPNQRRCLRFKEPSCRKPAGMRCLTRKKVQKPCGISEQQMDLDHQESGLALMPFLSPWSRVMETFREYANQDPLQLNHLLWHQRGNHGYDGRPRAIFDVWAARMITSTRTKFWGPCAGTQRGLETVNDETSISSARKPTQFLDSFPASNGLIVRNELASDLPRFRKTGLSTGKPRKSSSLETRRAVGSKFGPATITRQSGSRRTGLPVRSPTTGQQLGLFPTPTSTFGQYRRRRSLTAVPRFEAPAAQLRYIGAVESALFFDGSAAFALLSLISRSPLAETRLDLRDDSLHAEAHRVGPWVIRLKSFRSLRARRGPPLVIDCVFTAMPTQRDGGGFGEAAAAQCRHVR